MERIVHPKTYIQILERQLRSAIGFFAFLITSQLLILVVGPSEIALFIRESSYGLLLLMNVLIVGLVAGGFILVQRITLPEGMHIWIDNLLYGSLQESNRVIFDSLILALTPPERVEAMTLPNDEKFAITDKVFSDLANDPHLFVGMVRSKLFKFWNLYWMLIYGSVSILIATLMTLIGNMVSNDPFITTMFYVDGAVALVCVVATVIFGQSLRQKSQTTVESIVDNHRERIADMIRDSAIKALPEFRP